MISEKHHGRPKHVRDFDLNFGLHNLLPGPDSRRRRVWMSPLWQNFVFLGFLALMLVAVLMARANPNIDWRLNSLGQVTLISGVLMLVTFIVMVLTAGALHRARLVFDLDSRELIFYRSLIWPRVAWRLRLDDIAAVGRRKLTVPGAGEDSTSWTYDIVVVELKDGRFASIAFDSSPGIQQAISDALNC